MSGPTDTSEVTSLYEPSNKPELDALVEKISEAATPFRNATAVILRELNNQEEKQTPFVEANRDKVDSFKKLVGNEPVVAGELEKLFMDSAGFLRNYRGYIFDNAEALGATQKKELLEQSVLASRFVEALQNRLPQLKQFSQEQLDTLFRKKKEQEVNQLFLNEAEIADLTAATPEEPQMGTRVITVEELADLTARSEASGQKFDSGGAKPVTQRQQVTPAQSSKGRQNTGKIRGGRVSDFLNDEDE